MRVVFFGATELGYRCCERLLQIGTEVVGIFTTPQDFRISYAVGREVRNVQFRDFHQLGREHGIPVVDVEGRMRQFGTALRDLRPDLLVVIGWYYMIPLELRALASLGCIGVHASLLPRYRGGAPLVWAIINGEDRAGATLFYFDDGVDSGDIIGQYEFPISRNDTIADVLEKASLVSLRLVEEFVPHIGAGDAPRSPQDQRLAHTVPQRSPADGEIDWAWSAERIRNFVRAQTHPYPGAFSQLGDHVIRVWGVEVTSMLLTPGEVGYWDGQPIVGCSDVAVLLTRFDLEPADSVQRLPSGTVLGRPADQAASATQIRR